jgi:hypothetical protein
MEKIIKELNEVFEILDEVATHAECKHIKLDSENQQVLTVDLFKEDEDILSLVYTDKAYILGEQPFGLTDEEIESLKQ